MRIDIRFSSCNHHPTTQLSLTSHSPQVRVEYHVVYRIYLLCAVAPGLRPGSTLFGSHLLSCGEECRKLVLIDVPRNPMLYVPGSDAVNVVADGGTSVGSGEVSYEACQ